MLFVLTLEKAVRRGSFVFFFFSDKFISVLFMNNACSESFQSRNMSILVKRRLVKLILYETSE